MLDPSAVIHSYPEPQGLGRISQTLLEEFVSRQVSTMTSDKLPVGLTATEQMLPSFWWGFFTGVMVCSVFGVLYLLGMNDDR